MKELGFEVVKLVDLNLTQGENSALETCIKSDLPVFIKSPKSRSLWAIKKKHKESINSFRKYCECSSSHKEFFNTLVDYHLPVGAMTPLLMNVKNSLLLLSRTNIEELIKIGQTEVLKSSEIYSFVKNQGYKFSPEVSLNKYPSSELIPFSENSAFIDTSNGICDMSPDDIDDLYADHLQSIAEGNIPNSPEEIFLDPLEWKQNSSSTPTNIHSNLIDFTLCEKNKVTLEYFDDPLNYQQFIVIKLNDCFISESSANHLRVPDVSQIPENSPYFVPAECRYSSDLNKLAVLGDSIYSQQIQTQGIINLTKHIMSKLGFNKKTAATAAFFISASPKGNTKVVNEPPQLQFKNLVALSKKFFPDGVPNKINNGNVSNQVIAREIEATYGYSPEKCRYAVKLIFPNLLQK